nr:hypothetical protein [Tanacetum cinerariifolium]
PSPTPPSPPPQPPQDLPSTSQRIDTSDDTVIDDESNQERIIDEMDKDDAVTLMDDKEEEKKDEEAMVIENDQEGEPTEVQEVVDVVTTAKLITKVFANIRRVGKGFFGVETPLFEGILVGHEIEEGGDEEEHVEDVTAGDAAQGDDT